MKRSVAILGLTPPFVRWAMDQDCTLREPARDRIPDRVFRQLRGIRELSRGYRERRVVDGICLHPDNRNDRWEVALGFLADEVTALFGGLEEIRAVCSGCPANAQADESASEEGAWAGCFGWMTHLFRGSARRAAAWDAILERFDLEGTGPSAADPTVPLAGLFRLWQTERWEGVPLQQLQAIWRDAEPLFVQPDDARRQWICFADAIHRAIHSRLGLVTELVPAGHSDGRVWRLFPHCSRCRAMMSPGDARCTVCGRVGRAHPEIRRKVLGIRPYGRLIRIIGPDRTREIVHRSAGS